jgi:hypothetical protein
MVDVQRAFFQFQPECLLNGGFRQGKFIRELREKRGAIDFRLLDNILDGYGLKTFLFEQVYESLLGACGCLCR